MYWFDRELEKVLSSEDFVFRAIEKTMSGTRHWNEARYPLVKHLLAVIHSDIGHVANSYENKSRIRAESINDLFADDILQPDIFVQKTQEIETIKTYVKSQTDDIDMLNVIKAIVESELRSNKEISELLGISVKDVVNTKKRLKRLFKDFSN